MCHKSRLIDKQLYNDTTLLKYNVYFFLYLKSIRTCQVNINCFKSRSRIPLLVTLFTTNRSHLLNFLTLPPTAPQLNGQVRKPEEFNKIRH